MRKINLPLLSVAVLFSLSSAAQVGIGTTSPSEILDIESSDGTKTAIDINNTSTGDPVIQFQVSGTTYFTMGIDNSDGDKFKIGTSNLTTNNSITIDAAGDVGINDTDPGYNLEVGGDMNLSSSDNVYRIGGAHVLSKPNVQNIYVGEGAGNANNADGSDNVFVGYNSGYTNSTADYSVYIGSGAGYSGTTGGSNVAVGFEAGYTNSTGSGNVFLGYQAGRSETGSGYLYIENSSSTTPLIYGDFTNDDLTINGSLVVNEQSADEDFRVESNNKTHMLFVDASTDQVIVGSENSFTVGASTALLQVSAEDATSAIAVTRHSADNAAGGLIFTKARGTEASPSSVSDGDVLGAIKWHGYDGTDYASQGAEIEAAIEGTPGGDDIPTRLNFKTTADGAASPTTQMTILPSGFVGIGETTPTTRLYVEEDGATVATFNRLTDNGTIIDFQKDGTSQGSISYNGTDVLYNAFSGAHFAYSRKKFKQYYLVSMNGRNKSFHGTENSEILYGISYTTKKNDPSVLGAYSGVLEPKKKHSVDNPHQVMAVGNGHMWVTNTGGDIEIGDYLISSDITGCAMKDSQDEEVSYIVARAGEKVDWENIVADEKGIKRAEISVFFESFKKYNHQVKLQKLQKELETIKAELNEQR